MSTKEARLKALDDQSKREGWFQSSRYWKKWDAIYFEEFYKEVKV